MKTVVVYTSQTGFTKKYAEWISEKANADILELKEAQKKEASFFDAYDTVIYAGWCMAGKVVGSNWFFNKAVSLKGKKLAIVLVGASPNENPEVAVAISKILTKEQSQYIKAFYCQGGLDYNKMKSFSKFMLKMFAKSLASKKDATEDDRKKAEMISHSYDIADKKYIEPILAELR